MEVQEDNTILVTGISGYIGSHVGYACLEAGYKVRGTIRSLANPKKVQPIKNLHPAKQMRLELKEANLLNDKGWDEAMAGCQYVMHVASPFPVTIPKSEYDIIVPAVQGTLRVLKYCAKHKVKKVVVTSSVVAIMGGRQDKLTFNEDDWAVDKLMDAYGKSKLRAETLAMDFVAKLPESERFELSFINPALVLGPAIIDSPFTSGDIIMKLLNNKIFGLPKIMFPIVDVRDVAIAHVKALENKNSNGKRYALSAASVWAEELSVYLRDEFTQYGYKIPNRKIKYCTVKFASMFDDSLKQILPYVGKELRIENKRSIEELHIEYIDPKKSVVDMGYSLIERGYVPDKRKSKK